MGQEDMEVMSKSSKEWWRKLCGVTEKGTQEVVAYEVLRPTRGTKCVISHKNKCVWFFLAQTAPICSCLARTTHFKLTISPEMQMAL